MGNRGVHSILHVQRYVRDARRHEQALKDTDAQTSFLGPLAVEHRGELLVIAGQLDARLAGSLAQWHK